MGTEMSPAEVIRMIREALTEMRNATLYIRTDENRIVIVATQDGKIVTLSSGPKHGENAIPVLREMRSATVRVDDTAISYHSWDMPPTPVLMAMLESDGGGAFEQSSIGFGAAPASGPEDDAAKAVLSRLLTEYLGPLASMCCDEVVESLGNSLQGDRLRIAIDKMAAETGGRKEAQAFRERAWKALKR